MVFLMLSAVHAHERAVYRTVTFGVYDLFKPTYWLDLRNYLKAAENLLASRSRFSLQVLITKLVGPAAM